MKRLIGLAIGLLALFLAAVLTAPAHAQVLAYSQVTVPQPLIYGQSVLAVAGDGVSYTLTCNSQFCPSGEVVGVTNTATVSYGLIFGSYVASTPVYATVAPSVAYSPVVSYSSAPATYTAPVSYATVPRYVPEYIPQYIPQYIPEPYAVPVYSGGCLSFCGFGSRFDDRGSVPFGPGGFPRAGHGHRESGETEPVCPAGQHERERTEACR